MLPSRVTAVDSSWTSFERWTLNVNCTQTRVCTQRRWTRERWHSNEKGAVSTFVSYLRCVLDRELCLRKVRACDCAYTAAVL
jgi:hypothetical protein